MTEIRESTYTVDLPGEWEETAGPEPGTYLYRATGGEDTLSVTLLAVKQSFSFSDPLRVLNDYLHHRSRFEAGKSGKVSFTEGQAHEAGDAAEGEWDAVDLDSGARTRHRVILKRGLLADFRYETPGLDEDAFDERAAAILSTATVTPPE